MKDTEVGAATVAFSTQPDCYNCYMRVVLLWLILLLVLPAYGLSQTPTPAAPPAGRPQGDLTSVLSQMDEASQGFRSAQADVELTQYTEIVKDTSKQSGQVFFRRRGNDRSSMDVALHIITPHPKQVVVSGDDLSFYDPKTGQCTDRKIGENHADVETMMNLGFGGRGKELLNNFDVKLAGWEKIDNVETARLELVPKSDRLKQFFTRLILWIDPKRDVPLQQQRFEPSGDYQLTHYFNIRVPGKISDDVFRLKTCGKG
jgi:outer membrane lipoprotein-sorting protein